MTINGCAVQQMSGGASNPSSPSSASGMPSPSTPSTSGSSSPPTSGGISMPSPSLPSGSQSSQSGSQSSQSGSSSSTSGDQSAGGNQSSDTASGNNSGTTGNASSNQGEDSQSGSGVMSSDLGSGQSASSIFDKSLGDFDKEMAEEREVIAAANQDRKGIMSEEIADAVAVNEGYATESFGNQGIDKIDQSEKESTAETSEQIKEAREDMPDDYIIDEENKVRDIYGLIVDEDEVARQIREAAELEKDPEIRAALYEEWRKYIRRK